MHPQETIYYQPIRHAQYDALKDKSGAYCVECKDVGTGEPGVLHQYLVDGVPHRVDGPAMVHSDGGKQWFLHGKWHREDGPAIMVADGRRLVWMQQGVPHRDDGPAVMTEDGVQKWFRKGALHREDGPAVEGPNGAQKWFLHGKQVAKKDMPYVQVQAMEKALGPAKASVKKRPALGLSL